MLHSRGPRKWLSKYWLFFFVFVSLPGLWNSKLSSGLSCKPNDPSLIMIRVRSCFLSFFHNVWCLALCVTGHSHFVGTLGNWNPKAPCYICMPPHSPFISSISVAALPSQLDFLSLLTFWLCQPSLLYPPVSCLIIEVCVSTGSSSIPPHQSSCLCLLVYLWLLF